MPVSKYGSRVHIVKDQAICPMPHYDTWYHTESMAEVCSRYREERARLPQFFQSKGRIISIEKRRDSNNILTDNNGTDWTNWIKFQPARANIHTDALRGNQVNTDPSYFPARPNERARMNEQTTTVMSQKVNELNGHEMTDGERRMTGIEIHQRTSHPSGEKEDTSDVMVNEIE